jgi:hypothetical protein
MGTPPSSISQAVKPATGARTGYFFCRIVPIAQGCAQHEQRAERRALDAPELVPDQQCHAAHAERQAEQLAPGQALAKQQHRERDRPGGHGVGEDRGAARGQHRQAVDHQQVPAGDVEEGDQREARPLVARDRQRLAARAQKGKQHA